MFFPNQMEETWSAGRLNVAKVVYTQSQDLFKAHYCIKVTQHPLQKTKKGQNNKWQ